MRHELEQNGEIPKVINTGRHEQPEEEIPSRIQGAVGIGVLGLGERHWNGSRRSAIEEAHYQGGSSAADKMDL